MMLPDNHTSTIQIAPSVLCLDMLNLLPGLMDLETLAFPLLHIDIIDGGFAPQTPLSIELFNLLRPHLHTPLDVHVMSTDNERDIGRLIGADIHSMCFHIETTLHTDRVLRLIRRAGIRAGIALMPGTSLSALDYVVELCDYILVMLINPGYAGEAGEAMVEYAHQKVCDVREYLDQRAAGHVSIEVDGRIALRDIPGLIAAGADTLVVGSSCLFVADGDLLAAKARIECAAAEGLACRKERGPDEHAEAILR